PRGDEADDGQAWLRDYVRREGVPSEALLPLPLRLRKEAERLAEAAPMLGSEQAVRDAVAELNGRIMEWRRIPVGPPVFVPLADEEALAARWREAHPAGAGPAPGGGERPAAVAVAAVAALHPERVTTARRVAASVAAVRRPACCPGGRTRRG